MNIRRKCFANPSSQILVNVYTKLGRYKYEYVLTNMLNSKNLVNVLSPGKCRVYTEVLSALIGLQAIVQL